MRKAASGNAAQRHGGAARTWPRAAGHHDDCSLHHISPPPDPKTQTPNTTPPHLKQVGFIANLKGIKSHTIVSQALRALGCMEHRGACSADDDSGDGAGLMTQVPWKVIKKDIPGIDESTTG